MRSGCGSAEGRFHCFSIVQTLCRLSRKDQLSGVKDSALQAVNEGRNQAKRHRRARQAQVLQRTRRIKAAERQGCRMQPSLPNVSSMSDEGRRQYCMLPGGRAELHVHVPILPD